MSLLQNSNAISAGGYDINNSLRLRKSASAYLSRTLGTPTDGKLWTWSGWVKRGALGSDLYGIQHAFSATNIQGGFYFQSDAFVILDFPASVNCNIVTTQVFRDPSAWYHLVVAVDTTQATASNRVKIYVNGSQITAFSTATYPTQNTIFRMVTSGNSGSIGRYYDGTSYYFDGYLAEYNFIDGQALTPSSFGETDAVTGSWVAKKYTGTYGINGFYLPFNHTETNENLLTYSEQFDNAAWNKVNFTATANSIASPLGAVVADRILETTANSLHACLPTSSLGVFPNLVYTFSVYVKSLNNQYVQLIFDDTGTINGGYANFDLTAGTVTQSGNYGVGSNIGATITSLGSGWYRISISTKLGTGNNARASINGIQSGTSGVFPSYVGNASNGYYVWGAQVNYGSTANDYILTTASIVNQRGTTENSFTYSQDFTNAAWTKNASSITANTTTAPDGTTTASKLVENATLDGHQLYRTFTESNITRTLSVYAKLADASRPYVSIAMSDFVAYECRGTFNISNGTIFSTSTANANWTNISTSITSVGNGWYRCTLTATKGAVNPTIATVIGLADASGNTYYTGSGTTLGTFIWGAQFEETSSVGPYLPTVASAQSKVFRIGADKSLGATGFGYNSWIPNNTSLTYGTTYDAMTDSPSLTSATVANYCVLNPLNKDTSITVTDANLSASAGGTNIGVTGSIAISSGKWYWEVTQTAGGVATSNIVGITDATLSAKTAGLSTNSYGYGTGTTAYKWNAGTNTAYGSNWTNGDVISVAFDADAGTITFYKNNVSQGTAFTGISGTFYPAFGFQNTSAYAINFGQRPFAYTPPTGYKALNTYNLPDSTIKKGNKYMDATAYTGVGATQTITGYNFQPELVWVKARSAAYDHKLVDVVRGLSGSIYRDLESNTTDAEGTPSDGISSLNSDGFTITGGGNPGYNGNTTTFVAWAWDAGSSTVTNTSGSISSQVRANTTAGFSIVTYTGTGALGTVGHGLGVAPSMLIIKSRSAIDTWRVYHASLGNTKYINLNDTSAAGTASTVWNNTSPTSSVFTINTESSVNGSGRTQVAYCWAEIAGFSKFGSYTGNGSADGPMIFTGFKPKFVMFKRTDTTSGWYIHDSTRNTSNVVNLRLLPNTSDAEATVTTLDFLSNGFKLRTSDVDRNASGGTYIYACFASNPFKNSNAV